MNHDNETSLIHGLTFDKNCCFSINILQIKHSSKVRTRLGVFLGVIEIKILAMRNSCFNRSPPTNSQMQAAPYAYAQTWPFVVSAFSFLLT